MKIVLEYVAMLDVREPPSGSVLELADGASVADVLDRLGIAPAHRPVIVPFIQNGKVRQDTMLKDGDRLFLAMPVGGG